MQAINDYSLPSPWSIPLTIQLDATGRASIEPVVTETVSAVDQLVEKEKAEKKPKKKRRRVQSFVTLLIGALILAVVLTIAWIGLPIIVAR